MASTHGISPAIHCHKPAVAAADERQLQIWLTPHGFLKAAADNNATAKPGKDGAKKVTVLAFMAGKNKITGDIDSQNLVTKVDTWIPNPVLGDMLVETTYTDYKDFDGVKFPTHIVQKEGGWAILDLSVTSARANVANACSYCSWASSAGDCAPGTPRCLSHEDGRRRVVPGRRDPQQCLDRVQRLRGGRRSPQQRRPFKKL